MSTLLRGLAALALALPLTAHAQIGVAAGANFSSLGDARAADLDQSTGWHVGVFAQARLATVGLRASVLYMDAGNARSVCPPTSGDTFCTDIYVGAPVNLISVPVDVQLRLPLAVAALYVAAGPDVRFPVRDGRPVFDARSVNLAASGAVGAELGRLFLELRYARDVTGYARSVADDPDFAAGTDYELDAFMLRAGVGL